MNRNLGSPFLWTVVLSQVLGISMVVMVIIWTSKETLMGGLGWKGSGKQFNMHPFSMVAGFVFCMGEAALIYRLATFLPKLAAKIIHVILQTLALVGVSLGLTAIFQTSAGSPTLSIHSWCGLTTAAIFFSQYILGWIMFMVRVIPGLHNLEVPKSIRMRYLPLHRYFGTILLFLAAITCISGITEFLGGDYGSKPMPMMARIGNSTSFLLVAFVVTVGFIIYHPGWRREENDYINLDSENDDKSEINARSSSSVNDD